MLTTVRAALAGRYVLEREVGRGSAAAVYAARDLKHGRRIALKVMHPDVVNTSGTNRFLREIRTTASLNHPHVLPLFDSGEADGFIFYTMPLVEGESLRRRIERDGPMAPDVVASLIGQLASALAHAHALDIVHRDVKPENILIGDGDHAWIADFGLARALASAVDQRLTGTSVAVGSPPYMSPEQASGQNDVDRRSDVYALGCIAYELLCGSPPFTAGTTSALLARHLASPVPSVLSLRPDLPAAMDAAIGRALAKERTHRFDSATDFATAFRTTETSADTGAGTPALVIPRSEPAARSHARPGPWRRLLAVLRRLVARARHGTQVPATDLVHTPASGTDTAPTDTVDATRSVHEDAPPPRQWDRPALPVAVTPFVNRHEELEDVCALLRDSHARLVTVTGPGGIGKTRFALKVAEQMADAFRDGVAWTALSGLSSVDLLPPSIADALGIPLSRREDPASELAEFLHEKELLLVLDNFEHLTGAAGLLPELLDEAPGVRILVTTRERLHLRHETLVTLDGLSVEATADEGYAVQLFVAGARRLDRQFRLADDNRADVARICELLNGLPLAIELASAWVRTLSCREIVTELERDLDVLAIEAPDVEARHRSMRATFDASWRLLDRDEQATLSRLAVFRSAFDSAVATQVAEADARLIRQLVDKSLLARSGARLHMLDVVRTYALERLQDDPDAERRARDRHLACFTSLLHEHESGTQRADPAAIGIIAASIDDVRAAWNYATQTRDSGALLRAMDALFHFYEARGWSREGAEVFARTGAAMGGFDLPPGTSRSVRLVAARLAARQGVCLQRLGDLNEADALLERAAAVAQDLDDVAGTLFATHRQGVVRHGMGDFDSAERLHREGWELAQRLDDQHAVGWSMAYLGNVHWSRGEFDEATRLYTDALVLMREAGDINGTWVTVNNLGVLAASRHQYEDAQRRFREGLALQADLRNPRLTAHVLHNLGSAARELGDTRRAREWLKESLDISDSLGYRSIAGFTLVGLAELAVRDDDLAGAGTALHRALRIASTARNHPLALEALITLARVRHRNGDTDGAAELASIVAAHPGCDRDLRCNTDDLFREIGREPVPTDGIDLDAIIDRILGLRAAPAAFPTPDPAARRRRPTTNVHTAEDS